MAQRLAARIVIVFMVVVVVVVIVVVLIDGIGKTQKDNEHRGQARGSTTAAADDDVAGETAGSMEKASATSTWVEDSPTKRERAAIIGRQCIMAVNEDKSVL